MQIKDSWLLPDSVGREPEIKERYLRYRKQSIAHFKEQCDWRSYVFCFRPECREVVLLQLMDQLPSGYFYQIASDVWNDVSLPSICCDFIGMICLDAKNKGIDVGRFMMNQDELSLREKMIGGTTAYRSHAENNCVRCSWTTCREWAIQHGEFAGYSLLSTCKLEHEQIYAVFSRRRTLEVIVDVSKIEVYETMRL